MAKTRRNSRRRNRSRPSGTEAVMKCHLARHRPEPSGSSSSCPSLLGTILFGSKGSREEDARETTLERPGTRRAVVIDP